jgi:hypothetical protein
MSEEMIELGLDATGVKHGAEQASQAVEQVGKSATTAKDGLDKVDQAAGRTSGAMKEGSRAALQMSQAMQDVMQGGLASGLNNVDGIVNSLAKSFGVSASAASAFSAAALGIGTAALVIVPAIKEIYAEMTRYGESLPPPTDGLARLNAELKEHKEILSDIESRDGELSPAEVEKYIRSKAKAERIEAEIAETKEMERLEKALRDQLTDAELKDRRTQSAKVREAVSEEQDALIDTVKSKAIMNNKAVLEARERLAAELKNRNDFLSTNGIFNPFASAESLTKLKEAEAALKDAMRKAGVEGMKSLEEAFKGDNEALKKIIEIVGPNSEFAADLRKALAETWKPEEAFRGMAERGGKVLDKFFKEFQKQTKKGAEEQRKLEDEEAEKDRQAANHREQQRVEHEARFNKWKKEELPKQEKEWRATKEKRDKEMLESVMAGQSEQLVRDVNKTDFFSLDKYGREKDGVKLTDEQIKAAGLATREFQNAGVDDRTAAQLAIQETMMAQQQQMADKVQNMNQRLMRLNQGVETVPSLLEYGSGY